MGRCAWGSVMGREDKQPPRARGAVQRSARRVCRRSAHKLSSRRKGTMSAERLVLRLSQPRFTANPASSLPRCMRRGKPSEPHTALASAQQGHILHLLIPPTAGARPQPHSPTPPPPYALLVKQRPVVVLATRVTAAARVLAVLAHAAIAHGELAALVPRLPQAGRLRGGWGVRVGGGCWCVGRVASRHARDHSIGQEWLRACARRVISSCSWREEQAVPAAAARRRSG